MEDSRQQAFQKLRLPCIELSSRTLKFRGHQASIKSLLQALEVLHSVVLELGQHDALDEKLAEYVFFPLSNVFNESHRLSSGCLEVAVQCLHVLVSRGWRQKLQPAMGKQLLILLSLLAGVSPARAKGSVPSEELICACFVCIDALFNCLGQAEPHIFDETSAKTIVDQNVYLLLEAIEENPSQHIQLSASTAMYTLLSHINSRLLLASLLPRTVSALTKAAITTTQIRRTYKVLVAVLQLLSHILLAVLADDVAIHEKMPQALGSEVAIRSPGVTEESATLDEIWLKTTASQVKLALANVVKLRNHERQEVQHALFSMCLMICQKCSKTLSDSLQLVIETMVVLTNRDGLSPPLQRGQALKHLVLPSANFVELLKNSLSVWVHALPRLMQGNDDKAKRQILIQISTAFEILLESGQASDLLDDALATSLVESVSTAVDESGTRTLQAVSEAVRPIRMIDLQEQAPTNSFEPVILYQKSQLGSLAELQALVGQIKRSVASQALTKSIMARIEQSSGTTRLAALWLTLHFLQEHKSSFSISEFIDMTNESCDTVPYLISDLYSIVLPILLDSSMIAHPQDWRVVALALESTILQANVLGTSFRTELIDSLYPILSLLGSPETRLQSHAMTALNLLAKACEYPNTSTMLVENVDYLINSIAIKLNAFDISPQGPQVVLMLLRLCGPKIIPYLDDLIGSIFAALDSFHGYPQLVELLFEVLGVVIDEAAKNPALVTANGIEEPKHKKTPYLPSSREDVLLDLRAHKERKERSRAEILKGQADDDAAQSVPHRPWTSKLDGPQKLNDHDTLSLDSNENSEHVPSHAEEEKEPPLSKPHNMLLSIARSTIPHLSSPSSRVRLTLLQLIARIVPILARHENSFLLLVNDIWPAILPRLLSLESRSATNNEREDVADPAFVNIASADAIAAICIGAGDFMSGRVEDIFPRLEVMYSKIWADVRHDQQRMSHQRGDPLLNMAISKQDNTSAGTNLRGVVDLRIVKSAAGTRFHNPSSSSAPDIISNNTNSSSGFGGVPENAYSMVQHQYQHRTSTPIHDSLVSLLTAIITHVHVTDQIGDAILSLLSPIMDEPGREALSQALEVWNADAVWVVRELMIIEREMEDGVREWGDWSLKGKRLGMGMGMADDTDLERKPEPVSEKDRRAGDGAVAWVFGDVLF